MFTSCGDGGRYDDEVLRPIIVQAENLVRLEFAKKVKVAPGSDAGAYMVPHPSRFRTVTSVGTHTVSLSASMDSVSSSI